MKFLLLIFTTTLICCISGTSNAQKSASDPVITDTTVHIRTRIDQWTPLFGSFLEPNRFSTVYDAKPNYLRLEAGFGGRTLTIGQAGIGAECLVWSGLKTLSNFRFPVETADYFFGIYGTFPIYVSELPFMTRVRISHISSHWVDGVNDSIVGGSSSHYSREFASIEFFSGDLDMGPRMLYRYTIGAKVIFHQVTKVESTFQLPLAIEVVPVHFGVKRANELLLSWSSTAGAYSPTQAVALVSRFRDTPENAMLELYGEYHFGDTRYGVKGTLKENGFEIGIRLGKNLLAN